MGCTLFKECRNRHTRADRGLTQHRTEKHVDPAGAHGPAGLCRRAVRSPCGSPAPERAEDQPGTSQRRRGTLEGESRSSMTGWPSPGLAMGLEQELPDGVAELSYGRRPKRRRRPGPGGPVWQGAVEPVQPYGRQQDAGCSAG